MYTIYFILSLYKSTAMYVSVYIYCFVHKPSLHGQPSPPSDGYVVGPLLLGRTLQKPKMGHNLSSNWLQRCKPDLSTLQESDSDSCHQLNTGSVTSREAVEDSLRPEVELGSGVECSVLAEGEDSELDMAGVRVMGREEENCAFANDEMVELEEEVEEEKEEEEEEG